MQGHQQVWWGPKSCPLYIYIHIFGAFVLMHWYREIIKNLKGAEKILCPMWGSISWFSEWGSITSCQLSSSFIPHHRDCAKKQSSSGGLRQFWTADNPSEITKCYFNTCVSILNCTLVLVIYIFVILIFDAVAQGNAYNPQKSTEVVVPNAGIDFMMFRPRQHHQHISCFGHVNLIEINFAFICYIDPQSCTWHHNSNDV